MNGLVMHPFGQFSSQKPQPLQSLLSTTATPFLMEMAFALQTESRCQEKILIQKNLKKIKKALDFFPGFKYTIKRAKEMRESKAPERVSSRSADVAELAYAHDSGSCPG